MLRAARADRPNGRRLKAIAGGVTAMLGGASVPAAAASAGGATLVKIAATVAVIVGASGGAYVAGKAMIPRGPSPQAQGRSAPFALRTESSEVAVVAASSGPAPPSASPSPVQGPLLQPGGPAAVPSSAPASSTRDRAAPVEPLNPGRESAVASTTSKSSASPSSLAGGIALLASGTDVEAASATGAPNAAPSEVDLLRSAENALRSDPALALSLANQDAARYPSGALAQERQVIVIEALLALGRRAEAQTRAAELFGAAPDTAYRARIEGLLADGSGASLHKP